MRTLFEIVEGARDGTKPTHDECYFAMLALDALRHFERMDVRTLCEAIAENKPSLKMRGEMTGTESFNRSKKTFATDPQKWLGKNVPGNPEHDRMRKIAYKVFEKATGVDLKA